MDTVQINWAKGVIRFDTISQSENPYLDRGGFYAILGAKFDNASSTWKEIKLLYIGQAFDQTLREFHKIILDMIVYLHTQRKTLEQTGS